MTRPCRAASTTGETVLPGAASRIVLHGQARHKDRGRSFVCSRWGSVEAPSVSTPRPAGTRDHTHGTQPRPVLAWVPQDRSEVEVSPGLPRPLRTLSRWFAGLFAGERAVRREPFKPAWVWGSLC